MRCDQGLAKQAALRPEVTRGQVTASAIEVEIKTDKPGGKARRPFFVVVVFLACTIHLCASCEFSCVTREAEFRKQ